MHIFMNLRNSLTVQNKQCFTRSKNLTKLIKKSFTYSKKSEKERAEYLEKISDNFPENHVFIDECGHEKDYVRPCGRALRGVRVQDTRRGRKFGRTNVVAALCEKTVLAPKCYEHSTNGDFFEEWFVKELLPLLNKSQTITLDNTHSIKKTIS